MRVARFMWEPICRIIRAVVGLALVVLAFLVIGGTTGIVVGLVGLVLIAAGTFNFCLIAPLIGAHFDGRKDLEARSPTPAEGRLNTEVLQARGLRPIHLKVVEIRTRRFSR